MPDHVSDDDLNAYVDGFLDADARVKVERFLATDQEAAARVSAWQADRMLLRGAFASKDWEPIPRRLSPAGLRASRPAPSRPARLLAASLAVAFLTGVGAGWLARGTDKPHGLAALEQQAVIATRVFSADTQSFDATQGRPKLQIGSDDSSSGRTIEAPDLTAAGYALIGARVIPTEQGSGVLFLYRDPSGQRMGMLVKLMVGIDTDAEVRAVGGHRLSGYAWAHDGVGICIVSNQSAADLRGIAERLRDRMVAGT